MDCNERYEMDECIGNGGFGSVYLATDRNLGIKVAIKKIKLTENSKNEVSFLLGAHHDKLPRIYDYFESNDEGFIVMEYVEGITLREYIDLRMKHEDADALDPNAPPSKQPTVNAAEVVSWMLELCDIFIFLHEHHPAIIYRDLKPANIMIGKDGHIKLVDFGAAFERDYASENKDIHGTGGYMAPEILKGSIANKTSDIYSLGAVLYEMLTGKNPSVPPYLTVGIRELNRSIPASLEMIIRHCTDDNPNKRYHDVRELQKDLERYDRYPKQEKMIFGIKKCTLALSYIVAFLSTPVKLYSDGLEKFTLWDVEKSLMLFSVALLLHILLVYVSPLGIRPVKIEKQIWLTRKNYSGLYGLVFGLLATLGGLAITGGLEAGGMVARSEIDVGSGIDVGNKSGGMAESEMLWVDIKDSGERKFLLKENSVFEVEDMVRLEIPSRDIPSDEMNFKIVATDNDGKVYESRKFRISKK